MKGSLEDGLAVFCGIPFARPPVGDLRFEAPRRPERWDGVRDATKYSPAAPQPEGPRRSMFTGAVITQELETSEDCLYLNVWTPAADGGRRPVMVYIHGGAFRTGSGSSPNYEGANLARRGDVVVVTTNYRLGALGFLYLPGFKSANFGTLDQIAALEWVHDNIGAFGGDPDNVTVFGESAGGKSVETLLAAPAARGLFRRAILQSTYDPPMDMETAVATGEAFLREAGLKPGDIEGLRALPVEMVIETQTRLQQQALADLTGRTGLVPVVDGQVVPEHPRDAIARGAAADVPVIIGTTMDESRLFGAMMPGSQDMDEAALAERLGRVIAGADRDTTLVSRVIEGYRQARLARGQPATASDVWFAISTDRTFRNHSVRLAEAQSRHQPSTYMYLFTWVSAVNSAVLGACHAIDVPFVFENFGSPLGALAGDSAESRALAGKVMDAWISFARSGDLNTAALPEWRPYDTADRATMLLGAECRLEPAPQEEERCLWEAVAAAR
jgi:para-nitrobenzyl esterase